MPIKQFTAEARARAMAARNRKTKEREANKEQIEVFAVRRGSGLTWEIRQFGGLILASGTEYFSTAREAVAAGELARRARSQPA